MTHSILALRVLRRVLSQIRAKEIAPGYKRVYHYHIRKTGGTSLRHAFLSDQGHVEGTEVYDRIVHSESHSASVNGKVFQGWDQKSLEKGNYFYGWSHIPAHRIHLPPRTFTITIFRDPVARLESHYNNLRYYLVNDINHPCLITEGEWACGDFSTFVSMVPREHRLRQLFMFSPEYSVAEAVERIRAIDHVMFLEEFECGLTMLSKRLGIVLPVYRAKKFGYHEKVTEHERELARVMLASEYTFISEVKRCRRSLQEY